MPALRRFLVVITGVGDQLGRELDGRGGMEAVRWHSFKQRMSVGIHCHPASDD